LLNRMNCLDSFKKCFHQYFPKKIMLSVIPANGFDK